jgi:hypothetical protein
VNTVDEYWEVNGQSLHLPGWNITTIGGSRFGVPAMVGSDLVYAYVPGENWQPKSPAPRTLSLAMWTIGVNPDTGGVNVDQRRQWNDNWYRLRRLFWNPTSQFTLTRRWLLSDASGNPYMQTASALGQLASPLEPSMTGRTRATFTADIKLADPFFYGTQQNVTVNLGTPVVIDNPGDYLSAHQHFTVDLVGPLNNPKLTNTLTDPQVSVTYSASIAAGKTVTLDVAAFTAITNENPPDVSAPESVWSSNRIGVVSHSGARHWFGLFPGSNTVTLTASSGTGYAVVHFRPPYI